MPEKDFNQIDSSTEKRFPQTSFAISCFDSDEEIYTKPVTYLFHTIIIAYRYRRKHFRNLAFFDVDYFAVTKKKDQPCIRYCDVLDKIIGLELIGELKPNHRRYLEDIKRTITVTKDFKMVEAEFENGYPLYEIVWGS